jgi:6-pyruvoyltetrahydropterin/6-carboxytetrahydropterin synthase|tara:strand:+ start:355 stop:621 length:267 start_codon:yes stop_codon:yes gene_type:complete
VINLNLLSEIVREKVIDKMDHKNLILDVDFMLDKITSAENIAIAIWVEIVTDLNYTGNLLNQLSEVLHILNITKMISILINTKKSTSI